MLLIRGFDNIQFAQEVNTGKIGCRDFASLVFNDSISGYKLSSYSEPLYHLGREKRQKRFRMHLPHGICDEAYELAELLVDDMAQETYLSFFHVVSPGITERWLETLWNDDSHFIYYEPKFLIDGYEFVVGPNYTGGPMRYLSSDEELSDRESFENNPGIVALLDFETYKHKTDDIKLLYFDSFNHFMSPLFNRTVDETFNDCENEFRFVMRTGRMLYPSGEVRFEELSKRTVYIDDCPYTVRINELQGLGSLRAPTSVQVSFSPNQGRLRRLDLIDISDGSHKLAIKPLFKKIDLRETAVRYGYIGSRAQCYDFIRHELYGDGSLPAEDENNHYFHGDWCDHTYVVTNIRSVDTIKGGFRPTGTGFYTS